MKALSEYMIASFVASMIAGFGEKIAPKGMKKYVTFVASLLLLIYLFAPIKSLGEELFGFTDNILKNEQTESPPSASYDEVFNLSRKKAEEEIQRHLLKEFSVKNNLSVSLTMNMEENGTILITTIILKLGKEHTDLADEMESYIENTFHTETSVILVDPFDGGESIE